VSLHDYRCPDCGWVERDVYRPITLRASEVPPICPKHQYPLGGTRMEWIPQAKFSLFSDSGSDGGDSFAKFTLPVEDPGAPGGFRQETVCGLSDIRRLERESEQREANGEGRKMVWRDYSQDHGNKHEHTLAKDPSVKVPKHYTNGTPVTIRRGDPVIADHGEQHLGPKTGPETLAGLR